MKNKSNKRVDNINKSDAINSVGGFPWLTLEICEKAKAKANDSADDACEYLRRCASKKGYCLGVREAFDVIDKYCS